MPEEFSDSWVNGWLQRGFRPKQVASFVYQNVEGKDIVRKNKFALFRVEDGKDSGWKTYAVQHRSERSVLLGANRWEPGIGKVRDLLYRRVELEKALVDGRDICLCEGEKDADAVANAWGVPATSHHQGAAGMNKSQAEVLARCAGIIRIFVDRDLSGYQIAWHQGKMLTECGFDKSKIVYHRPGIKGEKADISDHINAGMAREETDILGFPELRAKIVKHGELPTGTARRWSYYSSGGSAADEFGEWVVNREV